MIMNLLLAIFGSVLGLAVTAALIYTAWAVGQLAKQRGGNEQARAEVTAKLFLHWTVFDMAVLALFSCGTLLLLVDLLGVVRDRAGYPLYHYGYLLCGVIFTMLGMLFMIIRLAVVLRTGQLAATAAIANSVPSLSTGSRIGELAPNEHPQPAHADEAEQRV